MGSNRKALVAGGAGFIGSHLCERLLDDGVQVICLDSLWSGLRANISHLERCREFTFVHSDVTGALPDYEVQEIYHLASPASPHFCRQDPIHTVRSNVVGTLNLLELAERTGAKLLLASTSEVYGDPQLHPQHESYFGHVNPVGPRACYDEAKRCAETLAMEYRVKGVNTKIARIFNTFGPRMRPDDGRVVSNFAIAALRNEPIVVHGDGSQTRAFCFVSDLVAGLMRMMAADCSIGGPMNLGSDSEISILELANRIVAIANSRSPIVLDASRPDDPRRRRPSLELAREQLGWRSLVPLEAGLSMMLDHFRTVQIVSAQEA